MGDVNYSIARYHKFDPTNLTVFDHYQKLKNRRVELKIYCGTILNLETKTIIYLSGYIVGDRPYHYVTLNILVKRATDNYQE